MMRWILISSLMPLAAYAQTRIQPPVLLTQPTGVRTKVGQDITLEVSVRSVSPFSISWRKDGSTVLGSSERLTLRSVKIADSGVYDVIVSNADGAVFSQAVAVIIDPPRLSNLSVRMVVADGAVLIAGFVVDAPKRVLIRGVGRSLEQYGVPIGTSMPNPRMEVYDASGKVVIENDDYASSEALAAATAQSGAFPLISAEDAAQFAELPIGAYTVHLRSVDGKGGDALIEVFELQ